MIKVCTGTGGVASGGEVVLEEFRNAISAAGMEAEFRERCSADRVGCRGFCSKDVLVDVIINGEKTTYKHIKPDMVTRIFEEHIVKGSPVIDWVVEDEYHNFHEKQTKVVLSHCGDIDPEDIDSYIAVGGYEAARKAVVTMSPKEIVETIKNSNLRGRGGAGFPTGLKWELGLRIKSDVKYVICNGDEGDPGAFMDRSVMEGDPHSVVEGMIICAKATESQKGYVYVRAEYPLAVKRLQMAIDQCYSRGFLGRNIFRDGSFI